MRKNRSCRSGFSEYLNRLRPLLSPFMIAISRKHFKYSRGPLGIKMLWVGEGIPLLSKGYLR